MRAGGCSVQQALTPEAVTIVKQSLTLAHRRGHAQVTPLHVVTTMLSSSTGLFRSACLQSHSHYPLHCKALELCFNVALNRLPASSSMASGPHHHLPSLSNALVAAFKRAQAHQRRGSIETQQQPILAVKIELEQLVLSILDDPSVSRVMREAGFSSTQVKANVEQVVVAPTTQPQTPKLNPSEDGMSVVESLSRKRSVVVVGECLASIEGVVRCVMDRVEKGEVPQSLRCIQFITLPLFSFRNLIREEVEQKLGELKSLIRSCCVGAVLYLGDLKWVAEYRASTRGYNYCPIEHVIMEIRSLVNSGGFGGRFWVLGISTYKTYMKCRVGNPSLEDVLGLHPLTIPTGRSLELSLNSDRDSQSLFKSKRTGDGSSLFPLVENGSENLLTCCHDCSIKFETEARALPKVSSSTQCSMIASNLPSWLQQYKEETKRPTTNNKESMEDLCKKWNSICNSTHKLQHRPSEITLHFSLISPSSSSISSYEQLYSNFPRPSTLPCSNPNSNPNSTSSSDTTEMEYVPKFKELSAENFKILCNALEKKVSWQKAIIPEIASTILQCRSGMMRRKDKSRSSRNKEETWLFFQGSDIQGKDRIARELASLVFGSYANLVSINLSSFSFTRSGSTDDQRNKRSRSEASHSYIERFFELVRENPHRIILVEDIEQVDSFLQMGIKAAIEMGKMRSCNGEEVNMSDAIIILSCESFDSRSGAFSPPVTQKLEIEEVKVRESDENDVCLDLNLCVATDDVEDCSFGDVRLAELVDRAFFFKLLDVL